MGTMPGSRSLAPSPLRADRRCWQGSPSSARPSRPGWPPPNHPRPKPRIRSSSAIEPARPRANAEPSRASTASRRSRAASTVEREVVVAKGRSPATARRQLAQETRASSRSSPNSWRDLDDEITDEPVLRGPVGPAQHRADDRWHQRDRPTSTSTASRPCASSAVTRTWSSRSSMTASTSPIPISPSVAWVNARRKPMAGRRGRRRERVRRRRPWLGLLRQRRDGRTGWRGLPRHARGGHDRGFAQRPRRRRRGARDQRDVPADIRRWRLLRTRRPRRSSRPSTTPPRSACRSSMHRGAVPSRACPLELPSATPPGRCSSPPPGTRARTWTAAGSAVYPAASPNPNILTVAAVDQTGHLASFSNYGATSVDIAAPGTNIVSTVPGGWVRHLAARHVDGRAARRRCRGAGAQRRGRHAHSHGALRDRVLVDGRSRSRRPPARPRPVGW